MVNCNKFTVAIPFKNRICTTRVSDNKAINVLSHTALPYLLDLKRRCDGVGVVPGGCFPSVKTRKWRSLSLSPVSPPGTRSELKSAASSRAPAHGFLQPSEL